MSASKEQGGRVQPVSTPKKSPSVQTPPKLGGSFGVSPNSSKRGKNQK
jgi:hypothetical protein